MNEEKNMEDREERKLALLIDSDNVSSKYLNGIFDELSQYGIITYRRIYGDFTTQANARWSDRLLEKSIDGLGSHHRCDGPAVHIQCRRFLHCLERQ